MHKNIFYNIRFLAILFLLSVTLFSTVVYAQQTSFAKNTLDAYAPFEELIQVTPSDVTTYSPPLRGCIAETGGDIAVSTLKGASNVTITVSAGQLVPALINKVLATGTTATVICGR